MSWRKLITVIAVLAVVLSAVPVFAADQPDSGTEKKINEVVKGFFLQVEPGYLFPLATDVPRLLGGFILSVSAGYDILDILSIEAAFSASFSGASSPGTVTPPVTTMANDFSMKMAEVNLKVAYVSTEKVFGYVRVGGGASYNSPSGNLKGNEIPSWAPMACASLGVEYYTNIRHFSIGFDLKGYFLPTMATYFLAAQPFLKYSF